MNNSSGSIGMFYSYIQNGDIAQNEIESLVEVVKKELLRDKESSFLSACINTYSITSKVSGLKNIKVGSNYVFQSKNIIKIDDVCRWVNLVVIAFKAPEKIKNASQSFRMPLRGVEALSEIVKKLFEIDAYLGPIEKEDAKQDNAQETKKEGLEVKREIITDKEDGEENEKDRADKKINADDFENEDENGEEEVGEDDDLDGEDEEDPEVNDDDDSEDDSEDEDEEEPKESIKTAVNNAAKPQPQPQQKTEAKPEVKPQPQSKLEAKPEVKPQPQSKPEAKPQPKPQIQPQSKTEAKPEAKPQISPQKKEDAKEETALSLGNEPIVVNETKKEDLEAQIKEFIKKAEEEKARILKEAEDEKARILKKAEEEQGTIIADAEAEKEKIIEEAKVEANKKIKQAELDAEDKIKTAEGRRDNIIGEAVRNAARTKEDAANDVNRLKEDAQKEVNRVIAEGKGEKENIIAKAKLEEKAIIEKAEVEGNRYVNQRKIQLDDFKKLVAEAKSTVSKKALKTRSESKIDIFNTRSEIERIKKELMNSQELFKKLADNLNKIDGNIQSAIVDTTGKINKVADIIEFKEAEKATDLMLQIYDQVFAMHNAYKYYFADEETIHKDDVLDRLTVIEEVIEECLEEYGLSAFSTESGTPIDPARHEVESSLGGQATRNSIVKYTVKKGFKWDDDKVKAKEKIVVQSDLNGTNNE